MATPHRAVVVLRSVSGESALVTKLYARVRRPLFIALPRLITHVGSRFGIARDTALAAGAHAQGLGAAWADTEDLRTGPGVEFGLPGVAGSGLAVR